MFEVFLTTSVGVWVAFFAVLGLLLGSFANVIILRLPREESIVSPRSRCPQCKTQVNWYDNIPILSWLLLRAKCRACGVKISYRYPLVELIMAILFAVIYWQVGWSWTLLEYLIFAFGLVVVSFIDFDHMILPDVFTVSGVLIGLLGAALNPERSFMSAVGGVLMGGGFLWAIAVIYFALRKQEGMGGGDIKLLAWIGAVLGWTAIPFVILFSSVIGTLVGVAIAIKTKKGLKEGIPFGPYLALSALIYILGGSELGLWYLQIFIPSLGPAN